MAFPHPQEASRRAEISTRCQDAIPLFSGCPRLQLQKRLRSIPLDLLVLEFPVLVYNDLTVVADCHAEEFERARRGTFEINTALVIATPVTRAFDFLFRCQPVRRTSQVCADRGKNVNLVVFSPDHPDPVLVLRSEEHTSELQSQSNLVCRLLLEKKKPTPFCLSSGGILFALRLRTFNRTDRCRQF